MFDNDPLQFYPTPQPVVAKMLEEFYFESDIVPGRKWFKVQYPVLDPSAGKGALLKNVLQQANWREKKRIFACEIDPSHHPDLVEKGVKILAGDFLTFKPHLKFGLILMNPPFNSGLDHLLHAWDCLAPGGVLKCLLNAETYRNDFSEARKRLRVLIDVFGSTENYGQCFQDAERATNVEVVCIRLEKPPEKVSDDPFGDLNITGEQVSEFIDSPSVTAGLSISTPITNLVRRYDAAIAIMQERQKLAEQYNQLMKGIAEEPYWYRQLEKTEATSGTLITWEQKVSALQSRFWQTVFKILELDKRLPSAAMEKFEKWREAQTYVQFTEEAIYAVRDMFFGTQDQIMQDSVIDFFDRATRFHYDNVVGKGFKTNLPHELNKKIIIPNVVPNLRWSMYAQWSSHRRTEKDFLDDLDKVCKMFTGKSPKTSLYRSIDEALEAIQKGQESYQQWFDAGHVEFRPYKNGSLHIRFKDKSLVKDINSFISKHRKWLRDTRSTVSIRYKTRANHPKDFDYRWKLSGLEESYSDFRYDIFLEESNREYRYFRIDIHHPEASARGKIRKEIQELLGALYVPD